MSTSINSLIPELQPWCRDLLLEAGRAGLMPQITSTRRSHAEQTRLHRRYLAGLQPYYVAPPGHSAHEYGFAFDMVTQPLSALRDVGAVWIEWGGEWGGTGKYGHPDPVHFQYPGFVLTNVPDQRQTQERGGAITTAEVIKVVDPGLGRLIYGLTPDEQSLVSGASLIPGPAGTAATAASLIDSFLSLFRSL